jgi:hypothetical protein
MKNGIIGFLLGGTLGGIAGFAIAIFVYPFIFLADIKAAEKAPESSQQKIIATGTFIHADPADSFHYGKGSVTVYEKTVHLGADFEVGPGPKFHVYLVPVENVTPKTDVAKTMFVDLGRVRAFKGSQNFSIPAGIDIKKYPSVVIWCEQFGVLVSPAKLKFSGI